MSINRVEEGRYIIILLQYIAVSYECRIMHEYFKHRKFHEAPGERQQNSRERWIRAPRQTAQEARTP